MESYEGKSYDAAWRDRVYRGIMKMRKNPEKDVNNLPILMKVTHFFINTKNGGTDIPPPDIIELIEKLEG